MKLLATLNPEHASDEEIKTYPVREAARAIVIDAEGNIALLNVSKRHYYKLPGGGLEKDEDKIDGLRRECLEEVGCEIDVIDEIGSIIEYRKMFQIQQVSYCYLAKLKGDKGKPALTAKEVRDGFETVWLSYDEARQAMTHSMRESLATTLEGKIYIVPRDTLFLEAAEKMLKTI